MCVYKRTVSESQNFMVSSLMQSNKKEGPFLFKNTELKDDNRDHLPDVYPSFLGLWHIQGP